MTESSVSDPRSCKFFESCSSSLCPLDPDIESKIWCPEESQYDEICRSPDFQERQVNIVEKKIARIQSRLSRNGKSVEGYFTYSMLDRDFIVSKGIKGLDPDPPDSMRKQAAVNRWYKEQEEKWTWHHPVISEERRRRMRELGMEAIKSIKNSSIHHLQPGTETSAGDNVRLSPEPFQMHRRIDEVSK